MVEAPDSRSASPSLSVPPPRIPVSPVHLDPDLGGESDPPNFNLDLLASRVNLPTFESELVTINVAFEPEGGDMSSDLMIGFRKRMRKQFYEPIDVVTPAAKKSHSEESRDPPAEEVPPAPVPPPDTAGSSSAPPAVPLVREDTQPTQDPDSAVPVPPGPTSADPTPAPKEKDRKNTPPCEDPLTWEKMKEMLDRTPCFTDPEPPLTKMSNFCPPTVPFWANMRGDLLVFVKARLLFSTLKSAIARI